jgi:hypothetical protein
MILPMTRRLLLPLAALVLGGAAGCVDLKETPITGITAAYYNTPGGFDAAVNATYNPLRTFWALERGATMTVFGTDEYQKGADGSYKFFNDYTHSSPATSISSRTCGPISIAVSTPVTPSSAGLARPLFRRHARPSALRKRSSCAQRSTSRSCAPSATFRSR